MDLLAVLEVNDSKTGKLLAEVRLIVDCGDCADYAECVRLYGADIREYCENALLNSCNRDYTGADYEKRFDLIDITEREKELDAIADDNADYNDFVRDYFGGL